MNFIHETLCQHVATLSHQNETLCQHVSTLSHRNETLCQHPFSPSLRNFSLSLAIYFLKTPNYSLLLIHLSCVLIPSDILHMNHNTHFLDISQFRLWSGSTGQSPHN